MQHSRQLAARNEMVNWQVAPAEWEIVNYDEPKVRYRREVIDFLRPLQLRSLRKKTFVTIATNVLCADIASSNDQLDPIERDLYLPLEIALTKWSVADSNIEHDVRKLCTKTWLLNPGPPIVGSNKYAKDQKELHKIDYSIIKPSDTAFRTDFATVAKEINSMLTPDRTVFSSQLRNCRQDLGCLKWINQQIDSKIKPVKVFSLEDLYVVLIRRMIPNDQPSELVCQGIARYRMEYTSNTYEFGIMCDHHRTIVRNSSNSDTRFCARAITECYSNVFLNDIDLYTQLSSFIENNEPPTELIRNLRLTDSPEKEGKQTEEHFINS